MVEIEDAASWAGAVLRGLEHMETLRVDLPPSGPLILNLGDQAALNMVANAGLTRAFMREFAAYTQNGAFDFAWDD